MTTESELRITATLDSSAAQHDAHALSTALAKLRETEATTARKAETARSQNRETANARILDSDRQSLADRARLAQAAREEEEARERQHAERRRQRAQNAVPAFARGIAESANFLPTVEAGVRKLGDTMFNVFGGGLANSITSVFQALGAGSKINFQGMLGGLLQSIGQAAISIGTFAILSGTIASLAPGIGLALGLGNGPGLMAAGAALVAFGGAMTAAGAALAKKGQGTRAAHSAAAGSPSGINRAAGEVIPGPTQISLTVSALDPSKVDWEDLAENDIGPALERVVGRNASGLQVQPA